MLGLCLYILGIIGLVQGSIWLGLISLICGTGYLMLWFTDFYISEIYRR